MKIKTRDFGEISINPEAIIRFKFPIYGFEEYTDYTLISDPNIGGSILWLQSVQETGLCFIIVDPKLALPDYDPKLSEETEKLLASGGIADPSFWAIAVIPQEFRNSTVNLKSPILIDMSSKSAAQIILDDDYPIRCPLLPAERGK
jgi:flagellar assembly factor FliW